MKVQILQHISVKPPDSILDWLAEKNYDYKINYIKRGDPLPDEKDTQFLIVLGGALNVNDEVANPWLSAEKAFVKKIIFSDKPVLGICLGAQIIARALDWKVEKNVKPEMGWFDVVLTEEGTEEPLFMGIPSKFTPLHWHNDIIRLQEDVKTLAISVATKIQAFRYRNALALQFHLEQTNESLDRLLERAENIIKEDTFVQSTRTIKENYSNIAKSSEYLKIILNNIIRI
ncbi:MAG: type 1 glutamine amidotransferase [bacterium]